MKPFEKYLPIYQKALEHYEAGHPGWRIEVLVSLIQWSLKSLKHYIEDVRDPQITWETPLVELHYPIEWNWKGKWTENIAPGGHIYGHLTRNNTATRKLAVKTLSEMMARQFNAMTLADATNWIWFEKRKNYFTPVFPVETTVALNEIQNKLKRREAFEELVRPFSIGAARIDLSGVKSGARVPQKALKELGQMDISGIRFTGDVNGRPVDMGLVFEIHPLIADYARKKAYHPVVVGLAVLNGNARLVDGEVVQDTPADWRKKDRQELWDGLLKEIGNLTDQFVPKKQSEDSVIIEVNAKLKIPAEHWKPENRSTTIKHLADLNALGGELTGISIHPEGGMPMKTKDRACPVCGWWHDRAFRQIKIGEARVISLGGILPKIVAVVHRAHEKRFPSLSTKDDELLKICEGYRNPCKAFDDLNHRNDYKTLFNTRRRGFISLHGADEINRNKSEAHPE